MRLLAALFAAAFVYLAVGYLTGYAPSLQWRATSRATDMSGNALPNACD